MLTWLFKAGCCRSERAHTHGFGPYSCKANLPQRGPRKTHNHKDPTNNDFWYPPYTDHWNQSVGSLCLCGLLDPYQRLAWHRFFVASLMSMHDPEVREDPGANHTSTCRFVYYFDSRDTPAEHTRLSDSTHAASPQQPAVSSRRLGHVRNSNFWQQACRCVGTCRGDGACAWKSRAAPAVTCELRACCRDAYPDKKA